VVPFSFRPETSLCQFCATVIHNTRLGKPLGVLRQMLRREMSITSDHIRRLPAA